MYYQNNFDNNESFSDWTISNGNNSDWNISTGLLNGSTSNGRDIWLTLNDFEKETYKIKFKAINYSGVDQNIVFKSSLNFDTHYILGFRYNEPRYLKDNNNIVLYKYSPLYGYQLIKLVTPGEVLNKITLSQNVWHDIEILLDVRSIKVFFDNVQVMDVFDSSSPYIGSGGFGFQNHGGLFAYDTKNSFDDLKIMSLDHIDLPPLVTKNKIIIIPGLGASWNTEAMLTSPDDKKREWKMAPFVKNYDSLIKSFEDKGLIKNVDFFVWNYDWRRPISKIVTDFDTYVNSLGLSSDTKIDIVGHSLGGLVGRIWAQDHSSYLGKIATLGSPHLGAVDAYEAWNGAIISNNFGASKIGLNLLLSLQRKSYQKELEVIHSYAPVLSDLLPVFDFVKKNGKTVPYSNLFFKNNYLENKNTQINNIFEKLEAVAGTGFESKEILTLGERAIYDKILGYWPDGSVLSSLKTNQSDGTVLKKSAVITGDNSYLLNSKHANLPVNYIGGVFNILGLGKTINPISDFVDNEKLIFFIGSPAYLNVVCDDGVSRNSDELGFVVIDNFDLNSCRVNVIGTESGTYHLVLGNSAIENGWLYFEDSIKIAETKTVDYDVKKGGLVLSDVNKDYLYNQLINDVVKLQNFYNGNSDLIKVLSDARNKKINNVMTDFFKFRKGNKDYVRTAVILDEIGLILKIENKNISLFDATKLNKKFISDKSLIDRVARLNKTINKLPSEFGANSYKLMDKKMLDSNVNLKSENLSGSYTNSVLGSKLAEEIW